LLSSAVVATHVFTQLIERIFEHHRPSTPVKGLDSLAGRWLALRLGSRLDCPAAVITATMASAKPIDPMRVEAAALVNVSLFPCPSRCVTFLAPTASQLRQYTDRLAHHVHVVRTHAHTCSQTIALCCLAAHSKHTLGPRGTNKLHGLPCDALAPHVSTFSSPFLLSSSVCCPVECFSQALAGDQLLWVALQPSKRLCACDV
jgi:hypothetical protein